MKPERPPRVNGRVPVLSAQDAVNYIKDEDVLCILGAGGGILEATTLITALADKYKQTQTPRNLSIISPTGLGDRAELGHRVVLLGRLLAALLSGLALLGLLAGTAARRATRQRLAVGSDARDVARQIGHAHPAAVGAATVSVSWSQYVTRFLHQLGIDLPAALVHSPFETYKLADGTMAHGLVNLPAILIIVGASALLMIGIRESAKVNAIVVAIKLAVVAIVIGVGLFYVKAQNYVPFIPENTGTFGEYGWSGIMRGAGVVFFAWGEIFSLFPSILTDTFGTKHATTNYGFLYMAQGIGSLFGGPIAAWIYAVQGSWLPVFAIIITLDVLTAILAYFVLKPMRRRWLDGSVEPVLVGKPAMA